jgi:hypothetical protein
MMHRFACTKEAAAMSMLLTALLTTPVLSAGAAGDAAFDAPVQLTCAGDPIDSLIYPTPVLQDLDSDGKRELVLGDLRGFLYHSKPESPGSDLAWTSLEKFQSGAEPLKLHNW